MSSTQNKVADRFGAALLKAGSFAFSCASELVYGAVDRTLPIGFCAGAGSFLAISVLAGLDQIVLNRFGLGAIYPQKPLLFKIYCLFVLLSPFFAWGAYRSALKLRMLRRLTEILRTAQLTTATGKLPNIVFDRAIDSQTRKLRMTRAGLSAERFRKALPELQSGLMVYIDEIKEDLSHGTVDLIYSHSPIPKQVALESVYGFATLEYVVGHTRSSQIVASFNDTPHLLIAGHTGGGKSTFLRQMITTLYVNASELRFTLIDLKDGLEFQLFDGLERVDLAVSIQQAIIRLKRVEAEIKKRLDLLKENRCKDITAYQSFIKQRKKKDPEDQAIQPMFPHLIVVDEAAELFLASPNSAGKQIVEAKQILSRIARQGRSLGIHLVLATQRPDSKAVDPQVKANLPGVLCFHMVNDASSMTILGNGRATDLPSHRGRAIWKTETGMVEVQTPYLSAEEAQTLLGIGKKPAAPAPSVPTEPAPENYEKLKDGPIATAIQPQPDPSIESPKPNEVQT